MRVLLLALLLGSAAAINLAAPVRPDPVRTPGDVLTSDPRVICVPGYTKTVRNVPQALKEQVYRSYGILSREDGEYEIDHLIALELGGSNSVRNLWPESFKTQPLNAHVKDRIEDKLHALACAGTISFPEAQRAIATSWEAAYVKYIGPLPGSGPASTPPVTTRPPAQGTPVPSVTTGVLGGRDSGAVPPLAGGSCPAGAPVKVSRRGIYHLPTGDGNYDATRARACFATPAAAKAAGYRGIR